MRQSMRIKKLKQDVKMHYLLFLVSLVAFQVNCLEIRGNLNHQNHADSHQQQRRNLQSWNLPYNFAGSWTASNALPDAFTVDTPPTVAVPTPQIPPPQQTPKTLPQPSNSQPLVYTKSINNQFSGINLYHTIPTKFLLNQIYTFKGSVPSALIQKVNIVFAMTNDNSVQIKVIHNLNNRTEFEIPVTMSIVGKFYLTIFTGSNGDMARTQYEVVQRLDYRDYSAVQQPQKIDQLVISERENKVFVKWSNANGELYPIVKLTFEQYSTMSKVQFTFTNFVNQVAIPFKFFTDFEESTVSLAAVQAKSSTPSASQRLSQFSVPKMIFFDPIKHCFSQTRPELASFTSTPFTYTPGGSFQISGRALSKLKNQVVVFQPSKQFRSYLINPSLGQAGQVQINQNINLNIDISQQGIYIIEINHNAGYVVLNRPVYVGRNVIPLLPDSEDLKDTSRSPAVIVSQQPRDLTEQRNILLDLINLKRVEFGLGKVYLDDKLNSLAQQHTDDMVKRNYSSHYTLQGLGPGDRARNNKIYEQVGENIGMNSDIRDAHNRLCRSNIHLRNIVNPKWVRVGLGVKLNNNNSFVVTQEFSTKDLTANPIQQSELNDLKSQVLSYIVYTARAVKSENLDLSNRLSTYQATKKGATSAELSSYVGTFKYPRYSATVIRVSYGAQSLQLIKDAKFLTPSSSGVYTQVGLSIAYTNGFLQLYIGYIS